MSSNKSAAVAQTILNQLGGNKFAFITGARDFVHGEGDKSKPDEMFTLTFKIMRNAMKVTHVRIALCANDTYRMYFLAWNGRMVRFGEKAKHDGIYVDRLRQTFEENTGLRTSLAA